MSHESLTEAGSKLLVEAMKVGSWYTPEEFCIKEGRPTGHNFLAESLALSQVKIASFENFVPNQLVFLELQRSNFNQKQLDCMGIEFSFAKSSVAPFMKISIVGKADLLFKFAKGESERSGGLLLLPNQELVDPEKSWLRTIRIGENARHFSFVFGDNPTLGKGIDSFYLHYKKVYEKTLGKID
jgi:hypothetical protein